MDAKMNLALTDPVVVCEQGEGRHKEYLLAERSDIDAKEYNGMAQVYRWGEFVEGTATLQSFFKFNPCWQETKSREPADYGIEIGKEQVRK